MSAYAYQDNKEVKNTKDEKNNTLLMLNLDMLSKYNSQQREYLYSIEEKLNCILNRRVPIDIKSSNEEPDVKRDFLQMFNSEIDEVNKQNSRIEKIFEHLSELI